MVYARLLDDLPHQSSKPAPVGYVEGVMAGLAVKNGPLSKIETLYMRQGGRCAYCEKPMWFVPRVTQRRGWDMTLDHVISRSRGGSNGIGNCVAACARCNAEKGARTPEEWMADKAAQRLAAVAHELAGAA